MSGKSKKGLFFIIIFFIAAIGFITSLYLKSWWPILTALSLLFIITPRWWTILILGTGFAFYLHSGWPLIASVALFFIGKPKRWWPIPTGIAFALVEFYSFYLSDRPLGITRGYTVTGAIIEYLIAPDYVDEMAYWQIYEPIIDWTIALITGVVIGSFVSSRFSGDFRLNTVPDTWKMSMGPSTAKRWAWAFIAGIMMGFAARIAGGCVSGLLISGVIQLAPSGFIFMIALWIGGVVTTLLFYRSNVITIKRE